MPYKTLSKILLVPFFILIISGLVIPSDGQHGALNIKSLSLLFSLMGFIGLILIKNHMKWEQFKLLAFVCFSVGCLFLWMIIFVLNQNDALSSSFDQFKIFLITILAVSMSIYFVRENVISFELLFKVIIFSNFTYSLYKIVLISLSLLGFIDLMTLLEYMGIRVMLMEIYAGISRFQTSVDIVTPFLLFFFLQSDHLNVHFSKKFKFVYLLISAISIFFSFSRYLIFVALLSLILHWITLNFLQRISWFFVSLMILAAGIALVGMDAINAMLEARLFNSNVALSDDIRTQQINMLMQSYYDYPLFGIGLGGHTSSNIRDITNQHSYEVQWVAFLMQLGAIGILLLMLPLGIIFAQILKWPLTRSKVTCAILFLFWIISGFTNPFLISLTSGIIYSLFILSGIRFNQTKIVDTS